MFNKAALIPLLSQMLFGVLGAIIVQIILVHSNPQIVTVDIAGIVKSFENEILQQKLSQYEMTEKVSHFSQAMNSVVSEYGNDSHKVLVLKDAVISGGKDETDSIKKMIRKRMES